VSMRTTRVNELLRAEISELLLREVKDPRVSRGMVTITEVQVSPDLRHAVVYVSHLGTEAERKEALEGLKNSAHPPPGKLHRLSLRTCPSSLQVRPVDRARGSAQESSTRFDAERVSRNV